MPHLLAILKSGVQFLAKTGAEAVLEVLVQGVLGLLAQLFD